MSTDQATYTPEDLLMMPDGEDYELVDGQLVERQMSMESSWIAGRVFFVIETFARATGLGWTFPEGTSFQCFADDPERVRRPDTCFILQDRLPAGPTPKGHGRVVPDLVVEVVSPNDLYEEVDRKVDEWLGAGVQLVWVVNPRSRAVTIHSPDADPHKSSGADELTAEPVLAEFRCSVAELFPSQEQSA